MGHKPPAHWGIEKDYHTSSLIIHLQLVTLFIICEEFWVPQLLVGNRSSRLVGLPLFPLKVAAFTTCSFTFSQMKKSDTANARNQVLPLSVSTNILITMISLNVFHPAWTCFTMLVGRYSIDYQWRRTQWARRTNNDASKQQPSGWKLISDNLFVTRNAEVLIRTTQRNERRYVIWKLEKVILFHCEWRERK